MEISSIDCPKCGAGLSDQIKKGELFKCSNCGSTLVWPESQSKLVLSYGAKLCPQCGIDNEVSRNYCRNCGTALTKPCPSCAAVFYVGDKFCPNGHNYDHEQQKLEGDITYHLKEAERCAINGNLEQAAMILEEALRINSRWAPMIAGIPLSVDALGQAKPAYGYGLLVHFAGHKGKKQLAIQYIKRMLELNSKFPGDSYARQAAREAKVENEAKKIAKAMGVSWHWWE